MRKISEHLGQIIIALAGVALIIGACVAFRTPIGSFFQNIISKETGIAGSILSELGEFGLNGDSDGSITLSGDGQEFHKFAPATLSFRSTAPLDEFQEVQVNGVTVDPSNYTKTEGSTIITLSIDYLNTLDAADYEITVVSESGSPTAGFKVIEPELNEHGFYYNQPYTAYVRYPFDDYVAFVIRENGTMDAIIIGGGTENCTYTVSGSNITVSSDTMGTFNGIVSADGAEIYVTELATAFKLGDESFASDEDYLYIYDDSLCGYMVYALDKTKTSYGSIKTGINNHDTVKIADYAFYGNTNLAITPKMPDTVISIGYGAFWYCSALKSAVISDGVTRLEGEAFGDCTSLQDIVISDSVTLIDTGAFSNCTNLNKIIFNGTVGEWNAITLGTDFIPWNANVPATEVICSDGTVSLS